ncbi:MAG: hypothetical protein U1E78_06150 [Gammaproteobacteria bacterium]
MPQSEHQSLKHQLINIGMAVFFNTEGAKWGQKYTSSETLKEAIILTIHNNSALEESDKAKLLELASRLKAVPDEERYGTLKFMLPGLPSDSIIRFKRPDAQDVPHTEDFLARLQGQANAARRLLAENTNLSMENQVIINQQIDEYLERATRDIFEHCTLDPASMPTHRLDNDDPESKQKHIYLKAQQEKSGFVIQKFSDCLAEVLLENKVVKVKGKKGFFKSDDSDTFKKQVIKNQIYLKETELMSKQRAELVVVRPIRATQQPHIAVSIVPPVDPERTISSAKKDEQGLANFVSSENWVADSEGTIVEKRPPSLRSASLVPQDIFFDAKHDDLIREVTRMNARHHLLPALAEIAKNNPENKEKGSQENPIEINYTLQTLLSPMMEYLDKKNTANPDYLQVTAIRDALNEIADRPIEILPGQFVKLNVNYLNNGCNLGRGAASLEGDLNAKAFNQIVEKNISLFNGETFKAPINELLSKIPNFSPEEQGQHHVKKDNLIAIYRILDSPEHQMNSKEHARLTELEVKQKRHKSEKFQTPGLSDAEELELESLRIERNTIIAARAPLETAARELEAEIEQLHVALYQKRIKYFAENRNTLSEKIKELEVQDGSRAVNHLRAFEQYIQLTTIGYDNVAFRLLEKKLGHNNDNNKRNYQVQSALHLLCDYMGDIHHKTCKSGKDRTNSAEEMEQALHQASVIMGNVLQLSQDERWEQDKNRQLLISLYNEGYMHGNGNYICGQNMPPGAQQVSSGDIPSDIDVDVWKKTLAGFQKAAYKGDHLDNPNLIPNSHLNGNPISHATEHAPRLSQSLRHLGHFIHALDQSHQGYEGQSIRLNTEPKKLVKDSDNPENSVPQIQSIIKTQVQFENQKKEIAKIREHVQLMQDMTLKMILLDHQYRHLPNDISAEQRSEMEGIKERLSTTLNNAYQELQNFKSNPLYENTDYIARFKILEMYQEEIFKNPKVGLRKLQSKLLNAEALIKLLKIPDTHPPKITPQRTLNPREEKKYLVQYDNQTPSLTLTQRIIPKNQQTELMVTAQTNREQTTLDEGTLDHLVKIAQKISGSSPDKQIEVIAPNEQQAIHIAIALRTAGIKINLDSFNNGKNNVAFSEEARAEISPSVTSEPATNHPVIFNTPKKKPTLPPQATDKPPREPPSTRRKRTL